MLDEGLESLSASKHTSATIANALGAIKYNGNDGDSIPVDLRKQLNDATSQVKETILQLQLAWNSADLNPEQNPLYEGSSFAFEIAQGMADDGGATFETEDLSMCPTWDNC